MRTTTIKVSKNTHFQLSELIKNRKFEDFKAGHFSKEAFSLALVRESVTFDSLIVELINFYKKNRKKTI